MIESLSVLGLLFSAHFLAVLSPGPNVAVVIPAALRSRRAALFIIAGILPAGVVWAGFGLVGVGQVIRAIPALEAALRLAGGSYLIFLGARLVWNSRAGRRAHLQQAEEVSAAGSDMANFTKGFMTNFTNPKSIAYYTSIFAATGSFVLTWPYQLAAMAGMPAITAAWYSALTFLVGSGNVRKALVQYAHWIDRAAGSGMILFGISFLWAIGSNAGAQENTGRSFPAVYASGCTKGCSKNRVHFFARCASLTA